MVGVMTSFKRTYAFKRTYSSSQDCCIQCPCLSWVSLHGMAHSFIELDEAVVHVIILVSSLRLRFSVFLPSDGEG